MDDHACISVIIPAYNYAGSLPRAVLSVLEQGEPATEVVVVNDGSTDNTGQVLAALQQQWPNLIVVTQDNAGAAAARNHGVRVATGRYLLMLDADDELLPGSLATFKAALERQPDVALALGGYISVTADGKEKVRTASSLEPQSPERIIRSYLLDKDISISHARALFRRDVLETCPYPENIQSGEDLAVFAYALVAGPSLRIDDVVARVYKHEGSLRQQRRSVDPKVIADAVFRCLPDSCQSIKQSYYAQCLLSSFRAEAAQGDKQAARDYYVEALKLSPRQALRWTYVRKFLRVLV